MNPDLNVLILEDEPADAELMERELKRAGIACCIRCVATEVDFLAELRRSPDVVLADYLLPGYDGLAALALAQKERPQVPFIFVSGRIGEERAIDTLHHGARDYVLKQHLGRLGPAVLRATREAQELLERRRMEDELRLLSTAIDVAANGVLITDVSGAILWANQAITRLTGYSWEELQGKTPGMLKSGRQGPAFQQLLWNTILAGHTWRGEMLDHRKDGTEFAEEISITPIQDRQGIITHFVAITQDVSERNDAQKQIAEQAALLDSSNDAIYVTTLDGVVTYWNHGSERLYGWTRLEAAGQRIDTLCTPAGPGEGSAEELRIDRADWTGERVQRTRSGKALTVLSRVTVVKDETGGPRRVFTSNTDITATKQLEAQLFRGQRMESLGRLASGVAHDLNNVLAPVVLAAQLLRCPESDAAVSELAATIEGCAHRGTEIVQQLLVFGRGAETVMEPVAIRELIGEVARIVRETFPKSIRLSADLANDMLVVRGNKTQLHQILLNLCVNARDAMPEGGNLALSAHSVVLGDDCLTISPEARSGLFVRLAVEDSGGGIPPEIRDRIFEPFFTTKELGHGTGLGLSTVAAITRSHGGFVAVISESGHGTRFEVYLPAVEAPGRREEEPAESSLPRGHGEHLLVVDDEERMRDILVTLLRDQGFDVRCAGDGAEALAVLAAPGSIDLLLTDFDMPRVDGLDLIRQVRRTKLDTRIIVLSGATDASLTPERVQALYALGVATILQKPFSSHSLLGAIHRALNPGTAAAAAS